MKKTLSILLVFFVCYGLSGQSAFPLIPLPEEVSPGEGRFVFTGSTRINTQAGDAESADLFISFMSSNFGVEMREGSGRGGVQLLRDESLAEEEYTLAVRPDGITVRGGSGAGVFYGLQTLQQMIAGDDAGVYAPCVEIADKPRFGYRGLLLDVGRYFYPMEYVKSFIDLMSQYKFNRFHWHLTDDQGWRIEIKKHPELTGMGAWRIGTQQTRDRELNDRLPHGGFYTQDEIRDVVEYARKRRVEIIPEIDLPGHTMSLLAVYPELSCTGGPFVVPTQWGVKEDVLCIGNDAIFTLIEDILTEVMELFPGEYINIGGDEAPTKRWEACRKCRERMNVLGTQDPRDLQNWFTSRVSEFVTGKGCKVIGWYEIMHGGADHDVTVMSWQGEEGGIEAASKGLKVVMSPHDYMYLDYYQAADRSTEPVNISGNIPLKTVYDYEPYTPKLLPDRHKYIIGVQGNLWTEYIHSWPKVEYMLWPRALAVAETAWSRRESKDYDDFWGRMQGQLAGLDRAGVMFRIPEPKGWDEVEIRDGKAVITLTPPVEGAQIYYTINGIDPTAKGRLYTGPIERPLRYADPPVKCVVRLPSGRSSAVYTVAPKEITLSE